MRGVACQVCGGDVGRSAAYSAHEAASSPIHTVVRDTVFLLDRRLNEAEDGLETWVRMYRIDTSGCTWLEMG